MLNVLAIASVLLVMPVTTACVSLETSGYREEPVSEVYQDEQYEVTCYDSWNFTGHRRETWVLEPGMRQRLIDFVGWNLNDRISSIRIGYMVGVAMFKHRDFKGPATIYLGSQGRLDMSVNDEFSSLIIFFKDIGEPLGAWLGGTPMSSMDLRNWKLPEDTWFFPLPENGNDTVYEYRGVDEANDKANWVMVSPVTNSRADVGVEVTLFEHDRMRGNSITLPGFRSRDYYFDLKQYDFDHRVSSLVVRETRGSQYFQPRERRRYLP